MKDFKIKHWHLVSLYLIAYDVIAVAASYFFALWIRFDCHYTDIPREYLDVYVRFGRSARASG